MGNACLQFRSPLHTHAAEDAVLAHDHVLRQAALAAVLSSAAVLLRTLTACACRDSGTLERARHVLWAHFGEFVGTCVCNAPNSPRPRKPHGVRLQAASAAHLCTLARRCQPKAKAHALATRSVASIDTEKAASARRTKVGPTVGAGNAARTHLPLASCGTVIFLTPFTLLPAALVPRLLP